ncbi:hypothetical protein AB1Y20_019788 [Prymnesium parvum]|uniref:Aldehyde dehydrogenase domain-containing protein n=1 Tax=Prymnesium parvum TaxID=97485 RepID=A0AB34JST0_PRYPA
MAMLASARLLLLTTRSHRVGSVRSLATARSISPTTGAVVQEHSFLSDAEVQHAIDRSARALSDWKASSFAQRGEVLHAAAALLRERSDRLAHLMAVEMGKPVREGGGEVEKCAAHLEYFADNAERMARGEATEVADVRVAYRPLGLIFAIMPWNFPLWQVFRQAGTALAAGNTVLLKHAPNVLGCAEAIQDIFDAAGAPAGVFANLPIHTSQAEQVIAHAAVRAVAFTGSCAAGRKVAALAGTHLKRCLLELGGSDPYVVLEDADVEAAAAACAAGRLLNAGQSCIGAKRFIVVDAVYDEFLRHFSARMDVSPGDPTLPSTKMGPLCTLEARDRVAAQVDASVAAGASVHLGGRKPDGPGAFYPPTILTGVMPGMPAYHEELFGPVAAVIRVGSEAEAIRVANDTPFGLGAAVFTRDLAKGARIAEYELEAGMCFVNDFCKSNSRYPFGGCKDSGVGRECGDHGFKEFCNIKTVYSPQK